MGQLWDDDLLCCNPLNYLNFPEIDFELNEMRMILREDLFNSVLTLFGDINMTPKQIQLVQNSFSLVEPIADTAASLFYDRLFTLDPSLQPMFRGDMKHQRQKLMAALTLVVRGLHDINSIVRAVQHLGRTHAGYGVKDSHYQTVGEALIWTLGQGLGDAFTPDVEGAWLEAYTILATTMKAAAAEIIQQAAPVLASSQSADQPLAV